MLKSHAAGVFTLAQSSPWQIPAAGMKEDWTLWGHEHHPHLCRSNSTPRRLYVYPQPPLGSPFLSILSTRSLLSTQGRDQPVVVQDVRERGEILNLSHAECLPEQAVAGWAPVPGILSATPVSTAIFLIVITIIAGIFVSPAVCQMLLKCL